MELGICVRDVPVQDVVRIARVGERNGYTHLFLPEAGQRSPDGRLTGRDPFLSLAAVFAATTRLKGSVGVAAAIFHQVPRLALKAATLQEQSDGRFLLGVGVSHREAATRFGVPFPASPLRYLRDVLAELREASAGGMAFGNGFPVLVGALGERMVSLGASDADGVVLNWLTPQAAAASVARVRAVATAGPTTTDPGKKPLSVLYVRVAKPEVLRADAVGYETMINYRNHFLNQELRTPEEVVAGTCIAAGDTGLLRERIAAYAATGLDVLCLYFHGLEHEERDKTLAAASSAAGVN